MKMILQHYFNEQRYSFN